MAPEEQAGADSAPSFFHRRTDEPRVQPAPGLAPGKVVGDFRLVGLIGRGGMGQVWEAEQLSLHRTVAVKFLRPDRASDRVLELFAREARAGGRLAHPGIVTVHGHGESDGLTWIAMELVGGVWTLRDFIDEVAHSPQVPDDYDRHVARFVGEIADAMQSAHEAHVIHRDLKPQNVLITAHDRPKVTDFGLARITDEAALSVTGEFSGTYLYMSPEQVLAPHVPIDHRTDVFSLGIVLYELIALRRPFQGDTEHQIIEQIVHHDPPDPRTLRSKVPRDLAVIAGHALEKDRNRRYQTMAELAADLRRFLAHEPIRARPPTRLDRAVKWVKRHPARSAAASIALVAFAVITALLVANVRAKREVLRLSALQELEDLRAEAERLWPATPEKVPLYADWLARARTLVAELPAHERKLAELRARAAPWTEEDAARARARHPRLAELERARRELVSLACFRAGLAGRAADPTPEEVGVDLAALPTSPPALKDLAWPLVSPERAVRGEEAKGLVLARRAVTAAAGLTHEERAETRNALAWALFANGRLDDAGAEERAAVDDAPAEFAEVYAANLAALERLIEEELDPAREAEREQRAGELDERVAALEAEVARRSEWRLEDPTDRWWHDQLAKLVDGLHAFADPATGLASESATRGWSIARRAEFARTLAERSTGGADADARWTAARATIADPAVDPRYAGLRLAPQLGLLPLGRDPVSGLFEFAHLASGAPAERGTDGKLARGPETGLVLVLLPGGTFLMGAQRDDPAADGYDPSAQAENPVAAVTLVPFFLSKYEMTQGQWLRFTGRNPSQFYASTSFGGRRTTLLHPVEQVSWNDATETLARLGLVLPTEAQWEYAARAGSTTVWWTGDDPHSLAYAANLADKYLATHGGQADWTYETWLDDGYSVHAPVGRYAPNPFGLHDVVGNVSELCLDVYLPYETPVRAGDGLRAAASTERNYSNRGGSYADPAPFARSACRFSCAVDHAVNVMGVRPARGVDR